MANGNVSLRIEVEGLFGMVNDFGQLAGPRPYEAAHEKLNAALAEGFTNTQALVPVGEGDYRRPAGALRDSGDYTSAMADDVWTGSVHYGTEDDRLPYAVWARWKHHRHTGVDFLGDGMDDATPAFDRGVDTPWREVFNDEDLPL